MPDASSARHHYNALGEGIRRERIAILLCTHIRMLHYTRILRPVLLVWCIRNSCITLLL